MNAHSTPTEADDKVSMLQHENRILRSTLDDYRSMLEKYRTLADCSLAGIYVVQHGRFQYVNPRLTEMLGYDREEDLIGRHFSEIVHHDQSSSVSSQIIETGGEDIFPDRHTFQAVKKDGATVWLDLRGSYALYMGRPANIGTVVDVTEQKEAEEALRQSEEKYRTIIDHIEDGYYEVDLRGNLTFCNDSFARILGFERPRLLGLNYSEYAGPEQALRINRTFNQVYSTGLPLRSISWEIIRRDGALRHLELSISLIRDRAGLRTGFRGIARDVTEGRIVEQELRKHRNHLEDLVRERTRELTLANQALTLEVAERQKTEKNLVREKNLSESIVRCLPGVFYVYGREGLLRRWNEDLAMLTGYSESELNGKALLEFFQEHDRDRIRRTVADVFAHGRNLMEAEVVAKDGRTSPYYFSAVRAMLDGEPCLVGVGIDISDRKNFETALIRSEKELRILSGQLITAQEEERRRVAQELHDGVGQALTAAKVGLEGAIKRFPKDDGKVHLELLQRIIPTLQRAIDEVRRMSMDLRPSMLDDLGILSTLNWFCRDFRRFFPQFNLETRLDLLEQDIPDRLKIVIYRILQEALNNSSKHSQASSIRVRLQQQDRGIELAIEDNGLGFDLDRVLDADPDRRGFGLASMRERTELSGGTFHMRTAPGQGVRIRASWAPGS